MKYLFADLLREILFLPIWWYTIGLARMVVWCGASVKGAAQTTGLSVWAKNLFVPMYGETSISGKLISFFMRLAQIIGRFIFLLIWMIFAVALFIAYLILPIAVVYYLISLPLF